MTDVTMNKTSRQRILELIRKYRNITTSELNLFLDMTPANIRHHLGVLVADGLIEKSVIRKKDRGRPENVYSPGRSLSSDGLENVLEPLLDLLRNDSGRQGISEYLDRIAGKWAATRRDPNLKISPGLITNCIQHLNEMKYQAQWEAGKEGPLIRFDNCPYLSIIKKFPELCEMDRVFLEKMVDIKFVQIMQLEKDDKGMTHCAFIGHQERTLFPRLH